MFTLFRPHFSEIDAPLRVASVPPDIEIPGLSVTGADLMDGKIRLARAFLAECRGDTQVGLLFPSITRRQAD